MSNTNNKISVNIIYTTDKYGNKEYDYQEMAEQFAFQLWLLDRDNDVDINVNTSGYSDDLEEDGGYFDDEGEDMTIKAFGQFSFKSLEKMFGVRLFGLSYELTDKTLNEIKKEWEEMPIEERVTHLETYIGEDWQNLL